MISFNPLRSRLHKAFGFGAQDFFSKATERWVISPGESRFVRPAICPEGHLDKIQATEFAPRDVVLRTFQGNFETTEQPTIGYRFANIDLVDGVLYAGGADHHLRERKRKSLVYSTLENVQTAAFYESWLGNRWFGNWLSDDCLTYPMARDAGSPVATTRALSGHVPAYQHKLGIEPRCVRSARFEELILFDDTGNNSGKAERARDMRRSLLDNVIAKPVAGVFLLRGTTGDTRLLENEEDVAHFFANEFGFEVLDPSTSTIEQIVSSCGQASVVAGVEGSHLVHGIVVMPDNATLLTIQPPDRTVAALKTLTDRQGQQYAFVVADGTEKSFQVQLDDLRSVVGLIA